MKTWWFAGLVWCLALGCDSKAQVESCKQGCADALADACKNDTSADCKSQAKKDLASCQKHCETPMP